MENLNTVYITLGVWMSTFNDVDLAEILAEICQMEVVYRDLITKKALSEALDLPIYVQIRMDELAVNESFMFEDIRIIRRTEALYNAELLD